MSAWACPVECPVAARTSRAFAWSEVGSSQLSAPTFTPTGWAQ
jgi:hypothetical protein